jgi:hypothetical protein
MKIIVDELPKSPEECPFAIEESEWPGHHSCSLEKRSVYGCSLEWATPECRMLKVAESTPTINLDGAAMGENISRLTEQLEEMIRRNKNRGGV